MPAKDEEAAQRPAHHLRLHACPRMLHNRHAALRDVVAPGDVDDEQPRSARRGRRGRERCGGRRGSDGRSRRALLPGASRDLSDRRAMLVSTQV